MKSKTGPLLAMMSAAAVPTPTALPAAKFVSNERCPACDAPRNGKIFVCAPCWIRVGAADRQQLGHMRARGQNTASKLASVVRKLREKSP